MHEVNETISKYLATENRKDMILLVPGAIITMTIFNAIGLLKNGFYIFRVDDKYCQVSKSKMDRHGFIDSAKEVEKQLWQKNYANGIDVTHIYC